MAEMRLIVEIPEMDELLRLVRRIAQREGQVMATVQELVTQMEEMKEAAQKGTDVTESILLLLQGVSTLVTSLRQQLADAIAAGNDPTALQAVLDGLNTVEVTMRNDAQRLADAVVANTSADRSKKR